MGAEVSRKPGPLVEVAIPCTFCQTTNQVTVRADQVKSGALYRDGQSADVIELNRPGALLGQILEGMPLS